MNLPAAIASGQTTDLLSDYIDHVDTLPICGDVRAARRRSAQKLLRLHPDLGIWMTRPTPSRLLDLHRCQAWPFLMWCAVHRRLKMDAELLLCKPGGVELSSVYELAYPNDISRVTRIGLELGWSPNWVRQATRLTLPVICTWAAKTVDQLDDHDFAVFAEEVERSAHVSESTRYRIYTRSFALRDHLFQLGICAQPLRYRSALTPVEMAAQIAQPAIRREVIRYAETIQTVLRPLTVYARVKAIRVLCDWLSEEFPGVGRLDQLVRATHIEPFLAWARSRPWRGDNGRGRIISATQFHHDLVNLRVFFEDIAAWGWTSQPPRRLLFLGDLPRMPEPMPRALAPATDSAVQAEVAKLDDPMTRAGLILLRATGMRVGELLDLELDCLLDFGAHGTWVKVPVGKLGTERTVPLEPPTLEVLDQWMATRSTQRALPHPRHGRPADFLFMQRGRRLTKHMLGTGLDRAAEAAGITRPDGSPAHFTLHQLRHTFGTTLINAGISLPALMALMGHVTPEMTLRYARLTSPTIRTAYEAAMGKVRAQPGLNLLSVNGVRAAPDRERWLASEVLKTRVAHGYCSRDPVAGACPYANICEQCDNFVPASEFAPALRSQLADVTALRQDAEGRGWNGEVSRHARVAASLEGHLRRVEFLEKGDTNA
ncbi:hypothetical protein BH23ACT12_BH23ACT12_23740 [soil metagenome]